jgi:hypothetical protein
MTTSGAAIFHRRSRGSRGRTIPHAALLEAFGAMTGTGRRRLALPSDDSTVLALLCLQTRRLGFRSDADLANRSCTND